MLDNAGCISHCACVRASVRAFLLYLTAVVDPRILSPANAWRAIKALRCDVSHTAVDRDPTLEARPWAERPSSHSLDEVPSILNA